MNNQTATMRAGASARGVRGLAISPNFGSLPARLNGVGGARLGTLGDAETLGLSPALYYTVSYASSFLGGAAVGYVVAKKGRGAVTGGLTSSGIWCLAAGLGGARTAPPVMTAGLLGAAGLSLWFAWTRK